MRIVEQDKSDIVELADGSRWRIWPEDIALTLEWSVQPEIEFIVIQNETCTHALIDQSNGSQIRVVEEESIWRPEKVRELLRR